ncbi:LAFE_0D06612g1_1 [Lachancea fermentati]|uniref:LAFE_0D06612g1_1 n=1 Tax=Lachancea fermentati TaxID=4955 RepID=A0A1G4MBH9_LACFM|nr:LAFE_0D06612g1_1 [Lachancea fermentati]
MNHRDHLTNKQTERATDIGHVEMKARIAGSVEEDTNIRENEFTYAEGGRTAWLVTFGSFLGILPTWGLYFSAGIVQTYIASNQLASVSTSTISWIFSVYNFFMLGSGVFSGMYFDRNGAKKPLIIGSCMFLAGSFALGNCSKVWQFVICLSCLNGIGTGVLSSPLLGVICHYFDKKRSLATALAINGGSIGGVVYPLVLRSLYTKVGYPWTMRIMAFMAAVFLLAALALVKEDPSKRPIPEPVENGGTNQRWRDFSYYLLNSFDYKALSQPKFLFCTLATCLAELATGTTLTYITSYCVEVGYEENESFLIITVLNSLSIVGGYFYSFVADYWVGRFNVMIFINLFLGIVPLIMWLPFGHKSQGVLFAFSAIYGFLYGSLLNLAPVCCGQICRTDEFGRRYATMYLLVGLAFLVGIPITGAMISNETLQNYQHCIIFISLMSIMASLLYFLSKSFATKTTMASGAHSSNSSTFLSLLYKSAIKRF